MRITKTEIEAELRLFKAYTISDNTKQENNTLASLQSGILYTNNVSDTVKSLAEEMYGIKAEQWNQTFHKSFGTVLDTPIEKLVAQQLLHYFTTYGLESFDLYNQDLVYIPKEKLDIPDLESDIPLTVIRKIDEDTLNEKLMTLLTSGIALSKQTVRDVMTLSDYINKDDFDKVKNREVKIALYDKYGVVPTDAHEFLRYVTYKTTGQTLFIKSVDMLKAIKKADKLGAYHYFTEYASTKDGYKKLAEIYLANKQLFLAYKVKHPTTKEAKQINHIINRLDKLRKKYHKPAQKGILDRLGEIHTLKELEMFKKDIISALDKITVFREVSILNALKYRTIATVSKNDSIAYRIRNGKIYATESKPLTDKDVRVKEVLQTIIEEHLVNRLTPSIKGKTFYIPENVSYTMPTSEKQFIGEFPEGSYIEVPRNGTMVIGVHWFNLHSQRVDLDLKMLNLSSSYGWDTLYCSEDGSGEIVFSGDITDAPKPNGGSEAFLISPKCENKSFLVKLNNFTRNKETVPFEFFVVQDMKGIIDEDYVIDPNKVVMMTQNKFDNDGIVDSDKIKSTLTLGYVEITSTKIKIYFKSFEDVHSRISSVDKVNKNIFKFTELQCLTQLKLRDLISKCGGILKDTPQVETLEEVRVDNDEVLYRKKVDKVDFDLSTDSLTKDTIIKIFEEK